MNAETRECTDALSLGDRRLRVDASKEGTLRLLVTEGPRSDR
jgi:hypothetical protein